MRGSPRDAKDRSFNIFFDAGAWHGYSLPPPEDAQSGFVGPFVHSLRGGQWVGTRFARIELKDAASHRVIGLKSVDSHAEPGTLERSFKGDGITLRQTLFFPDSWRALVRIEIASDRARKIGVAIAGDALPMKGDHLEVAGSGIVQTFANSHSRLATRWRMRGRQASQPTVSQRDYRVALAQPLHLGAGKRVTLAIEQSLQYDERVDRVPEIDPDTGWMRHLVRWTRYLAALNRSHVPGVPETTADRVQLKAMMTLLGNWRAARGDIHHDGVIPSYSNPDFNGFWAWDSWKHAAALAHFAPDLARDQIRAMFDYQRADGMVPDCVFLDAKENNWRDTKPPLATWATLEIWRATADRAFVGEMYDKLVRYHRWWYRDRDHDHNGLAEYGSTDGTRIAAAWESGMDNAVRFDGAKMVRNGEGAWSVDQESVDLNSYLYREKLDLATLADVLGKTGERDAWWKEATALKPLIQSRMFDPDAGYFFDTRLGSGDRVKVLGSDGWSPLWAGVAAPSQAMAVRKVMLDPAKFATHMPFPTLARDDPHFSPIKGYWRGPLWMDQAWFAVEALRRNGFGKDADEMTRRLIVNATGLSAQAPIYENYDPLTGDGYQSRNFSWSAASYLLLLR
ncbi:MAG: glycoside hydrolase [Proteobacteria bacterium]|nr:glycoside hydrolase [Pseudomonadota bacterium]